MAWSDKNKTPANNGVQEVEMNVPLSSGGSPAPWKVGEGSRTSGLAGFLCCSLIEGRSKT